MSAEVRFLFLLGAIICWGLAAFATRVSPRVGLVPLGLALAFFPSLWEAGTTIF
ncbi:MAG: hypothetical protein ACRD1K_06885 [Acidimicrobiales bacterium]